MSTKLKLERENFLGLGSKIVFDMLTDLPECLTMLLTLHRNGCLNISFVGLG